MAIELGSFEVGDRIVITSPTHPHVRERGMIVAHATGGPRSVGLDWEIKLDVHPQGVHGCFVAASEIRHA